MRWVKGLPPKEPDVPYLIKYYENCKKTYEYFTVEYDKHMGRFVGYLGERFFYLGQYFLFEPENIVAYTTFDELNKDSGAYLIF